MNFEIKSNGEVSNEFSKRGVNSFYGACAFVSNLPYRRNKNKADILCIFAYKAGTCSTKHAVLRKLALENGIKSIKLILGIFKMDRLYNGKIQNTLQENNLIYIPEAHNYLKIENEYFDFTSPKSSYSEIKDKILEETEIEYNEIESAKVEIHRKYLAEWIVDKPKFSLEKIWEIREKCIADLQNEN